MFSCSKDRKYLTNPHYQPNIKTINLLKIQKNLKTKANSACLIKGHFYDQWTKAKAFVDARIKRKLCREHKVG